MITRPFQRVVDGKMERAATSLCIAALLAAPFVVSSYFTSVLTEAIIFGLFAISVNIALGYAGLLTLAPAAFFGIGAYSVAKTTLHFGGSYWVGVLAGVVVAAVVGVIIAYVPIKQRIGGIYFALFTMAFGVIVHDFTYTATDVTGGSNGLGYVSVPSVLGIDLGSTIPYYYLVLLTASAALAALFVLLRSDYGLILHAIRQNDQRMRYLGYDTDREQMIAWVFSCSLSAFSGALYVGAVGLASPDLMGFALTGESLIWIIVGGIGTLAGPFIAAFGLTILESILGSLWAEGYLLLLGLLFIAFVFLLPSGIMGLLNREK